MSEVPCTMGCMNGTAIVLEQAKALLVPVAEAFPQELTDDELVAALVALERVGRLVDAARVQWAAETARRSEPALGDAGLAQRAGHRRAQQFLEGLTQASPTEVARRIRVGTR